MRGLVKKTVLAAGSLVLALLLAELVLRLTGYSPLHAVGQGRELVLRPSEHPELRYELTPGAAAEAWGVPVVINARGYRGREGVPGRYAGTRVLVLGDSIAFGNYLAVEETFPWQLHELLRSEGSFEVLNLAVGGYDTVQEVARLRIEGLAYQPDIVVLAYCLNDAGSVSPNLGLMEQVRARQSHRIFRLLLAHFVADRIEIGQQEAWSRRRNDRELFRREYAEQIDPIGADERELIELMQGVPPRHPAGWYADPDRVGRIRHAFEELGSLADEHGFSTVVVVVPWLVGDTSTYPYAGVHRIVEMEARRAGLDTIDVLSAFQAAGMKDLRVHAGDPLHPDGRGHRILAEALRRYVLAHARAGGGGDPKAAPEHRSRPG